ncbi:unnamed protein product [Parascedosporium putredinis]|uniref:Uncharacterized protein n=1 Tax=Parascedosporium putredinis TaxID=1442378 RepID=A0A9P1M8Z7_9PEZI|nr:unnamed protein product [Parascedosporium putredinis]CAI7991055.1 unnamed protein product [Parascedosporium putredinis]
MDMISDGSAHILFPRTLLPRCGIRLVVVPWQADPILQLDSKSLVHEGKGAAKIAPSPFGAPPRTDEAQLRNFADRHTSSVPSSIYEIKLGGEVKLPTGVYDAAGSRMIYRIEWPGFRAGRGTPCSNRLGPDAIDTAHPRVFPEYVPRDIATAQVFGDSKDFILHTPTSDDHDGRVLYTSRRSGAGNKSSPSAGHLVWASCAGPLTWTLRKVRDAEMPKHQRCIVLLDAYDRLLAVVRGSELKTARGDELLAVFRCDRRVVVYIHIQAQPIEPMFQPRTAAIKELSTVRDLLTWWYIWDRECVVRAIAKHCVHALVLIVGRNAAAADKIVRECRESSPTSEFEFLAEDIILLQGVDRVCAKIRARVDKVDLLFMTPDFLSFASRQVSILAPVYGEAGFHLDDLDLKSHSGLLVVGKPIFWLFGQSYEECGDRMLFLSLTSQLPSRDASAGASSKAAGILQVAGATGAEAILVGSDGDKGSGAYCIDSAVKRLDNEKRLKDLKAKGAREIVWDHTMEIFSRIDSQPSPSS